MFSIISRVSFDPLREVNAKNSNEKLTAKQLEISDNFLWATGYENLEKGILKHLNVLISAKSGSGGGTGGDGGDGGDGGSGSGDGAGRKACERNGQQVPHETDCGKFYL